MYDIWLSTGRTRGAEKREHRPKSLAWAFPKRYAEA